jgi:hypothetical protein
MDWPMFESSVTARRVIMIKPLLSRVADKIKDNLVNLASYDSHPCLRLNISWKQTSR